MRRFRQTISAGFVVGLIGVGVCWAGPEGQVVTNQVELASYQHFLDDLLFTHLGGSRGAIRGAEHDAARDNIRDEFISFGLPAHYEAFTYSGNTGHNVIAEIVGTVNPRCVLGTVTASSDAGRVENDGAPWWGKP